MKTKKGWGAGGVSSVIAGDIYQPMETGDDNDLLTTTIAETDEIIPTGDNSLDWALFTSAASTIKMRVSTDIDNTLPAPVLINGTEETINSGKSWEWGNKHESNFIQFQTKNGDGLSIVSHSQVVLGCYLYFDYSGTGVSNGHDIVAINSLASRSCVLQVNNSGGTLKIRAHSSDGGGSTVSDYIAFDQRKLYWVNLTWDGIGDTVNGDAIVSVFDPANDFAHIAGSPIRANMGLATTAYQYKFGRTDAHGDNGLLNITESSFVSQIILKVDSIEPILPTAGGGGKGWGN